MNDKIIQSTTNLIGMKLNHCGDYAGKYHDYAYDIFKNHLNIDIPLKDNQWMDVMYFKDNLQVVAVWAEDNLTTQNSWIKYIFLDYNDLPNAFIERNEKEF